MVATRVTRLRSRMRSSWTGGTSVPSSGAVARSCLRSAGSTFLSRRSADRVDRASTTGCRSGTSATSSAGPTLRRARSAARSGPTSAASSASSWDRSSRSCRSLAATSPLPGSSRMTWPARSMRIRSAVSDRCATRCACSRSTASHTDSSWASVSVPARSARDLPRGSSVASTRASGPTRSRARSRGVGTPASSTAYVSSAVRSAARSVVSGARRATWPAQPDQPVHPVERARRLLVPVEDPDVEPLATGG